MRALYTIVLLVLSNVFMTLAWYGHLKFKDISFLRNLPLWAIVLLSWGVALFEYMLQVPANRLGHIGHGGPFSLWQLKVLQEVITLLIFTLFTLMVFRQEAFRWNYLWGFLCLVLAVYFIFKQ